MANELEGNENQAMSISAQKNARNEVASDSSMQKQSIIMTMHREVVAAACWKAPPEL